MLSVVFHNVKVRSKNKYTIEQAWGQTCPIFTLQSKMFMSNASKRSKWNEPGTGSLPSNFALPLGKEVFSLSTEMHYSVLIWN